MTPAPATRGQQEQKITKDTTSRGADTQYAAPLATASANRPVQAKAKREGVSLRSLILSWCQEWVEK